MLVGVVEVYQRELSGKTNRNDRLIVTARQSLRYSGFTDNQQTAFALKTKEFSWGR